MSRHRSEQGQRQLRVGEQLRHLMADILQRGHFRDPDLAEPSKITITAVEVSPDLKFATAWIMPLGGINRDAILAALNRASGYFRSEVAQKINLRYTPRISFELDTSFDYADKIEGLLRRKEVRRDLERPLLDVRDEDNEENTQ
jgi:ribosome-binding factor A